MSFPNITEKYGSLSATGVAKEVTFGTPVSASAFLPMDGNTMEEDPGWFSPHLMQNLRDYQVYNLYGEAKYTGTVSGPLFPTNGMEFLTAAIGTDSAPGFGVTGSSPTSATTLASAITASSSAFSLTSATGYAVGDTIQVDVNSPTTPTTTEVRKIATLTGTNGTVDVAWNFAHSSGVTVSVVIAPFTHTFVEQNTLPSLTVEKNIGGFQSLQFAGCRVGKFDLKVPTGNSAAAITADLSGQSVAVLNSPTPVSVITSDIPYVFAEASLTIFGTARTEASNVNITIDNGLKETYTYSGNHGPSFITPVTLHVNGTMDVVFDSLNDSTYGDFERMANGTLGALSMVLAHPTNGGTVTFTIPQIALTKYANDVKMEDVVMSSISFEATRPLTGSSLYTIQCTVANSQYLPF